MAKRKKSTKKASANSRDAGKTRFEVRFDDELYEQMKRICDEVGISVNQFISGIVKWAAYRSFAGELGNTSGLRSYERIEQPGTFFIGQPDGDLTTADTFRGYPIIAFDFTERHVVRDEWDVQKGKRKADQQDGK